MDNNNTFENYLIDAEGNWPTSVVVLLLLIHAAVWIAVGCSQFGESIADRVNMMGIASALIAMAVGFLRGWPLPEMRMNLAFFYFAVFAAQGIMSSARGGDVVGIWIEILFFGVPAAFSGFAAMEKYWRAARECRGES